MNDLLYLARHEVEECLPSVEAQLDLVERAYLAMAAGRVELPPKPGVHPRPDAFLHAMPAYLADDDVVALKWVAGFPENPARGLPAISGLIVVNDAETGLPVAVLEAGLITAVRTAAASGVCIRRFAPSGWGRAAVLGCGEQGRFHATVIAALRPDVSIRAYDPDRERAATLHPAAEAVEGPKEAVERAEVVVTATPMVADPTPTIGDDALAGRILALPVDFDASLATDAVAAADLFLVDDVGQFEYYRSRGHFGGWPSPRGTVGEAFAGGWSGDRVVCCNLGVGSLDAVFAADVLGRARERRLGTPLTR